MQQHLKLRLFRCQRVSSIELKAVVFPNSTTNYINLIISNVANESFSHRLFNMNKRLISRHDIINQETLLQRRRRPLAMQKMKLMRELYT